MGIEDIKKNPRRCLPFLCVCVLWAGMYVSSFFDSWFGFLMMTSSVVATGASLRELFQNYIFDSLFEVRNMLWIVHDCSMLASHHLYVQHVCLQTARKASTWLVTTHLQHVNDLNPNSPSTNFMSVMHLFVIQISTTPRHPNICLEGIWTTNIYPKHLLRRYLDA